MNTRYFLLAVGAVACLLLPACNSDNSGARMTLAATDAAGLERLYVNATREPQLRRVYRKPVRDARARAMRELAQQCEAMVAAMDNLPAAQALAGDSTTASEMEAYRESLDGLIAAANSNNRSAVRSAYRRTVAAQRDAIGQ